MGARRGTLTSGLTSENIVWWCWAFYALFMFRLGFVLLSMEIQALWWMHLWLSRMCINWQDLGFILQALKTLLIVDTHYTPQLKCYALHWQCHFEQIDMHRYNRSETGGLAKYQSPWCQIFLTPSCPADWLLLLQDILSIEMKECIPTAGSLVLSIEEFLMTALSCCLYALHQRRCSFLAWLQSLLPATSCASWV